MKIFGFFSLSMVLLACGGRVSAPPQGGDDPASAAPGGAGASDEPGDGGASSAAMPCRYLHGEASLTSYRTESDYASSAFSFEYASQDAELTKNEFDLLYEDDMFLVNLVSDDASTIVDLGDVPLSRVPPTVDVNAYPAGEWGAHDALEAQLGHTYFVRSVDGAGRLVSAFRVVGLEPGSRTTIEWVRSTDADTFVPPVACGL